MRTNSGLVAACLLWMGAGLAALAGTQEVDGVVAYVNDHVITVHDVAEAAQPALQQMASAHQGADPQARMKTIYQDTLNALVERHLILDAYNKRDQKLPEWAIEEHLNEIIRDSFNGDRGNLMTALTKGKITYEDWRSQVKEHIVVSAMRGDRIDRHTRVSPQAVQATYEANKDKYRIPDKVRLRMIVLERGSSEEKAAAKRKQADEIKKRLEAGEDFASLAKTESTGSKAGEGGDWGWMDPRMLRPELAGAISNMAPGSVSAVIETKEEFYIIKVEERKNGGTPSFEEVQSQIEKDLRQEEAKSLYETWIGDLKKKAYVKVLDIGPYLDSSIK